MFKNALMAVAYLSEEKIADKVDYLKKTCRWSDEVSTALTRAPVLLTRSKDMLRHKSEFLISQVGLEPAYIAHRPVLLYYSMEDRLKPQYYVLKFIKENGFLDRDWSFCAAIAVSDDVFVKKFIFPHKEVAPHLAEDCATRVQSNFKFTCTKYGL
jgi:mTERF domain-containing protein